MIGLAFFIPCTGVFTFNLVKAPRLILTGEGFRFTNFWRGSPLFEWHRVRGFHPWSAGFGTTLIAFTYDGDARRWHGLLARANRSLTNGNAALPTTYGMRPQNLADLLERWRQAYAGESAQGVERNQPSDPGSSSAGAPRASADPVASHTAEVWHVMDNQTPPTFKAYYVAHCICDWGGPDGGPDGGLNSGPAKTPSHTPHMSRRECGAPSDERSTTGR